MTTRECLEKWTIYNNRMIYNLPFDDNCKKEYESVRGRLFVLGITSIMIENITDDCYTLKYKEQGSPCTIKICFEATDGVKLNPI